MIANFLSLPIELKVLIMYGLIAIPYVIIREHKDKNATQTEEITSEKNT
jgi:hypothetical protein|tara:strand:- start:253 stop:399 length:147 start_codon:yes stop_codon:yes gene_type:complete